ncbi:unnamed protein product [Pylaiella littoralis]
MERNECASAGQDVDEDPEELRRQQAHLNFTASHQARHTLRQQTSSGGEGGDKDQPKEENAALFNETFAADTQDITSALARLIAESKQQAPKTAAGTGLSGARHAHGEAKAATSDDTSAAAFDGREGVREQLDALVDRVKGLRNRTAEATLFLTVYDLRRSQEEVGKLWASVESTRAELAPRKKFAFRSKSKTNSSKSKGAATPNVRTGREREGQETETGGEQGNVGPGLSGLRGQEVDVLAEDADKDKDFNVVDLDQCKVTILHVLGALRLRRLSSCRVVCGPVRGPVYVEGCKNCVIVAAGRQASHECFLVLRVFLICSCGRCHTYGMCRA